MIRAGGTGLTVTSAGSERRSPWLDRIAQTVVVCVLLLSCFLGSAQKDIWLDEAFTLQLLTDHSLTHMMHGLANAADGGMPLYYLLAFAWGKLCGTTLLSLRLLSSLFVCAGVVLLWNTLRKVFSFAAVALSIATTTITSALLLHQNVEARYYGFFFACAALVFLMQYGLSQVNQPSRRTITGTIVAHAALLMSHPFGLLYSLAAICALAFVDHRRGRSRWRLYLAIASSWLVLLLWIQPIMRLHDVSVPHNWPPPPSLSDVLSLYAFASPCIAFGVIFVIALSTFLPVENGKPATSDSLPLLALGIAYLLPPLLITLISLGDSSLFVDRYFIPSLIGVATLIASLFDSRLSLTRLAWAARLACAAVFLACLAWPLVGAERLTDTRFLVIDQKLPPNIPVVVDDAQSFLTLTYLSRKAERPYYFPLDWEQAVHSPVRGATVNYKLMRNAKMSGYSSDRVIDVQQLTCLFPNFLVLDVPKYGWLQERILNNSDFAAQHLGEMPHDLQLWSVRRVGNSTCAIQ